MRSGALWIVPLLLVGLAGCSGGDDDGVPTDPTGPAPSQQAPEWELGMHWTYDNPFGPPITIVVAEDTGSDWILLSDSIDSARFDATEPISFMGPTRKSDLAGSQDPDRVRFFDWPLEAGKTWTTQWDGVTRQVTAMSSNDGTWDLEAREGDFLAVEYNYDPEVRWFRHITFHDEEGGSASLDLVRSGEAFRGTVYRFAVGQTSEIELTGSGLLSTAVVIDSDATELGLAVARSCGGDGGLRTSLAAPQPDGSVQPVPPFPPLGEAAYLDEATCPADGDRNETLILEAVPGSWRADILSTSAESSSFMWVTPRTLVSIEL